MCKEHVPEQEVHLDSQTAFVCNQAVTKEQDLQPCKLLRVSSESFLPFNSALLNALVGLRLFQVTRLREASGRAAEGLRSS